MIATDEFGCGLLFPLQRDGQGDFRNGSGLDLLRNDVAHLLGIIGPTADSPGELPWNTALGCNLPALKHRFAYSELVNAEAQLMTTDTIRRWEPRVRPGPARVIVIDADGVVTRRVEVSYAPVGRRAGSVERAEIPLKG
jgi:phage baseplate assembly protein W